MFEILSNKLQNIVYVQLLNFQFLLESLASTRQTVNYNVYSCHAVGLTWCSLQTDVLGAVLRWGFTYVRVGMREGFRTSTTSIATEV